MTTMTTMTTKMKARKVCEKGEAIATVYYSLKRPSSFDWGDDNIPMEDRWTYYLAMGADGHMHIYEVRRRDMTGREKTSLKIVALEDILKKAKDVWKKLEKKDNNYFDAHFELIDTHLGSRGYVWGWRGDDEEYKPVRCHDRWNGDILHHYWSKVEEVWANLISSPLPTIFDKVWPFTEAYKQLWPNVKCFDKKLSF